MMDEDEIAVIFAGARYMTVEYSQGEKRYFRFDGQQWLEENLP